MPPPIRDLYAVVPNANFAVAPPTTPSITAWSRLEPSPTTPDLEPGLEAGVADPLWMLARQWQFDEWHGEDCGSPVEVRLDGLQTRPSRYTPGPLDEQAGARTRDYDPDAVPLEVQVEAEPVWATHPRLRAEAGLMFEEMLAAAGLARLRDDFRRAFPLKVPPADVTVPESVSEEATDPRGALWRHLLALGLDGGALAVALTPFESPTGLSGLPGEPALSPADRTAVIPIAARWLAWFRGFLFEPAAGAPSAWNPQRQEYALGLSGRWENGALALESAEYTDGKLDWYDFDVASRDLGAPAQPRPSAALKPQPALATSARFPGMPADRYWEFEDTRVNLAALDAGPTDLLRLLFIEFGLVYGNDWYVIPVEMPVGSVYRVNQLRVRDTFGVETILPPMSGDAGGGWGMFDLTGTGSAANRHHFFLPPTLHDRFEGDPLEEVALFRDEMANLAWGVERRVAGASGEARDRSLEPNPFVVRQTLDLAGVDAKAELIYRLATPVPPRWLPLVPVRVGGEVVLERRSLSQTLPTGGTLENKPLGALIGGAGVLRLVEEEVPREGALVQRSFQYARWFDGRSFLWVGRRKQVGTGEGSSGLRYDSTTKRGAT